MFKIKKLLSIVLTATMFMCISTNVFASDYTIENKNLFPVADGVDYGMRNENNRLFMSSYDYETSGFKMGVYLDNGNAFKVDHGNNPYFKATHDKTVNNNPDLFRVSYQAIYDSNGEVRQGIPFYGPIDNITVKFTLNETNNFRFYIAGDGSNTYTASGKLYYGGI